MLTGPASQVASPLHGGSADLPMNIEDDRYLAGGVHYIFVGKVVKQTGTLLMVGPQVSAQYAVEVISNIKGNLAGTVTVAQMGASVNTRTGRVVFLFGDTDYLLPGATYLLATRYSPRWNVYELWTPPYDRKLLTEDTSLSTEQLEALAAKDERVQALQKAYPNEILIGRDIKYGTTWNSYESLKSGHLFTPPPFAESNPTVSPELTATPEPSIQSSATPAPSL